MQGPAGWRAGALISPGQLTSRGSSMPSMLRKASVTMLSAPVWGLLALYLAHWLQTLTWSNLGGIWPPKRPLLCRESRQSACGQQLQQIKSTIGHRPCDRLSSMLESRAVKCPRVRRYQGTFPGTRTCAGTWGEGHLRISFSLDAQVNGPC